jgi:hypothetical protein
MTIDELIGILEWAKKKLEEEGLVEGEVYVAGEQGSGFNEPDLEIADNGDVILY